MDRAQRPWLPSYCRFIPVRSPVRRLLEVLLLVLVTSSLWFCLSYASPCRTLPVPVRRSAAPPVL